MHIFAHFFNNFLPFAAKRCYFASKSSITLKETSLPFLYLYFNNNFNTVYDQNCISFQHPSVLEGCPQRQ